MLYRKAYDKLLAWKKQKNRTALCMDHIQFSILQGDVSVNMGSILENVMGQMFVANGFSLHYFDTKRYGELDFVMQEEPAEGRIYKVDLSGL